MIAILIGLGYTQNDKCRRTNMKILAVEKEVPGVKVEDYKPYLEDEAKRVWELRQSDVIREIYYREDENRVVMVLERRNVAEAKTALKTLPLVKEKLVEFDVIPLGPYPGFSRLFSKYTT